MLLAIFCTIFFYIIFYAPLHNPEKEENSKLKLIPKSYKNNKNAMKIRLINFRCHLDKTFDFGENGLFLISAPSGEGKSSILMGINFALYGKGQKVVSHGQSSCAVEFTFDDLLIIRKKKPNKLTLKTPIGIYEDDVAQNIIDKKFSTSFDVTGYIAQNALNSFIVMSPAEKLNFLEKFSFNDINLEELRNKCKSLISKRNDEYMRGMQQTQTIEQVLSELTNPETVVFPAKKKDKELFAKNEALKLKNCDTRIKKNTAILNKAQKELNCVKILNSYIKNKEENIDNICTKLELLSLEEKTNDFIGDEALDEKKLLLQNLLSLEKLKILKEQYENEMKQFEDMKNREKSELESKIDTLQNALWVDYTRSECEEYITSFTEQLKDAKQIAFLRKQIQNDDDIDMDEIESNVEEKKNMLVSKKENLEIAKKRKKTYTCPCCDTELFFENDSLHISESLIVDDIDEEVLIREIKTLEKEIKTLENQIMKYNHKKEQNSKIEQQIQEIESSYEEEIESEVSLRTQLKDIEDYFNTQCTLEKNIKQLKSNLQKEAFSSSYSMTKNKVAILREGIDKLESSIVIDDIDSILAENEEDLRKLINEEENKRKFIKSVSEKRKSFEKEISEQKRQNEIKINEHIELYESIKTEEELLEVIRTAEEEIKTKEEEKVGHHENLVQIEKYNNYIVEKEKYDSWKAKLEDSKVKEEESKNRYNAAKILLEKIIESESIAMINVVDTINQHSQVYLEHFFPDNPIVVNLCCFKETKKNSKPQINVEISYKGSDCDITNLSGGETSRVILAFTLALAEIFDVPLLLLDECTASLDSESTNIVFETIKENFCNKTVLVVAHQCTEGSFDGVVSI